MTKTELASLNPDTSLLVDIREASELNELPTHPNAIHIPLNELLKQAQLNQLPKDKLIVTICRTDGRSRMINPLLQQLGYQTNMLEGGLLGT